MSYNLQIVKTSDFIRYDSKGQHDLAASKAALAVVARRCVERGVDCALIDIRAAAGDLPFTDVYKLAMTMHETGFQMNHRVAVLHKYRAGERAELFAMFAAAQGWRVKAFETYEDAMEWFSTTDDVT